MIIAFEGIDGTGKTTLATIIYERLKNIYKNKVIFIHMPGATPLGQQLRDILKNKDLSFSPQVERLLFAADNLDTLQQVIIPNQDKIILCDRWSFISDMMYSNDQTLVQMLHNMMPKITVDFLYVLYTSRANQRMTERGDKCRIEATANFEIIQSRYNQISPMYYNKLRYIDTGEPVSTYADTVFREVNNVAAAFLGK